MFTARQPCRICVPRRKTDQKLGPLKRWGIGKGFFERPFRPDPRALGAPSAVSQSDPSLAFVTCPCARNQMGPPMPTQTALELIQTVLCGEEWNVIDTALCALCPRGRRTSEALDNCPLPPRSKARSRCTLARQPCKPCISQTQSKGKMLYRKAGARRHREGPC